MQKLVKHVSASEREIEKERGKYVRECLWCAHAILERRVRNEQQTERKASSAEFRERRNTSH